MSKPVATRCSSRLKAQELGGKGGGEDEEKDNGEEQNEGSATENLTTSTTVSTVPATTDQFMHTPEFRIHFVERVPGDTLMRVRLATKGWNAAADALIDEGVESGTIMVHVGEDIGYNEALALMERCKLVTRVIFLLNITKIGANAFPWANNLVVVDIPEGIESIGEEAFKRCTSLTTVYFPTTLISIGEYAFFECYSLDNVDLLHTNLQKLGEAAFWACRALKSMTIPDSLQTYGRAVFFDCSQLVPSCVNVSSPFNDTTSNVVAHLRSLQN